MGNIGPQLTQAQDCHRSGDLNRAEALYREILRAEPDRADVWLLLGELCQAQGRRAEAGECYQNSLQRQQHQPGAYNNLGVLLLEQGRRDHAVAAFQEALRLRPEYPEALNNLGIALLEQGTTEEAGAAFRAALNLFPHYPEALNNLGSALARLGQSEAALAAFRQAVALRPDYGQAHLNLGRLLRGLGRTEEAAGSLREALRLQPGSPEGFHELGILLAQEGKLEEAVSAYRQVLRQWPGHAETHNHLGIAMARLGHQAEAVALFRQARHLRPDFTEAIHNLGRALADLGLAEEAIGCFRETLRLRPNYPEAHHNLGLALVGRGEFDEALTCYGEAVRLRPDFPEALNDLANLYKDQGRLDEAIACYRLALALRPNDAPIHSNLLYALLYHPGYGPETILAEHLAYGRQYAVPQTEWPGPMAGDFQSGRRLRLGYVSGDFRDHVMGRYIEAVLRAHDRSRFEIFCYAEVPRADALTRRLQAQADGWRSLVGLSDDAAADLIRQDKVDLLVDLAGHTGGNRLPVFAHRPAPVQATHFGYPCTTGLATMDFRITDAFLEPPGEGDRQAVEKLVRLQDILWCYVPPASPEVRDLPVRKAGFVTFGSFNNPSKLSEPALAAWAKILKALPTARMLILTGTGRATDERVRTILAAQGIEKGRVTLLGRKSREDYVRLYWEVDLCLDPFPYTGCNTSADALWMGVPVITLAGRTAAGRQGVNLLRHLKLADLVAGNHEEYVDLAVRLARDLERLETLRSDLRDRMRRSTLTDPVRFTRQLEGAYLGMLRLAVR